MKFLIPQQILLGLDRRHRDRNHFAL